MDFQKPTPKRFLWVYSLLISLLGVFSLILLAQSKIGSGFFNWYSLMFVLFNIVAMGFFLGKKYEMRSWAVPLAYLVFGFVGSSLVNTISTFVSAEGIYFLNFIRNMFLLLFILLVDTLYLHPHIKHVPAAKVVQHQPMQFYDSKAEKKPAVKKKAKK
jgi:hypothetical protein